jgi:hypothetical protein
MFLKFLCSLLYTPVENTHRILFVDSYSLLPWRVIFSTYIYIWDFKISWQGLWKDYYVLGWDAAKTCKVYFLLTFCPWIWKCIVHSSTVSVNFCRTRYCHMVGVLHANVMYKSYAESNFQWTVNKTSNEKKIMLCKKNTYIIKLLLNIVTTGTETLIASGSKFLYACVKEVCRLWA